jgi:hypothetical protein
MLCSRATRSFPFRESFISLRNVGKPSLKRTKRIFAIQKTSRSVRRWSFLKHTSLRSSLEGPGAYYAPVWSKAMRWTHRTPKHLLRNDGTRRHCLATALGVRARPRAVFSFHRTESIPINSRCQGTSKDAARAGSAAIASRAPRDATKDRSNPSCSAALSRCSRN